MQLDSDAAPPAKEVGFRVLGQRTYHDYCCAPADCVFQHVTEFQHGQMGSQIAKRNRSAQALQMDIQLPNGSTAALNGHAAPELSAAEAPAPNGTDPTASGKASGMGASPLQALASEVEAAVVHGMHPDDAQVSRWRTLNLHVDARTGCTCRLRVTLVQDLQRQSAPLPLHMVTPCILC